MLIYFPFQIENRALRLRDSVTSSQYIEDMAPSTSPAQQQQPHLPPAVSSFGADSRLSWDYFDEVGYIQRGGLRTGEDPYVRNRFNQQASDLLPSNRNIPDTRNPM